MPQRNLQSGWAGVVGGWGPEKGPHLPQTLPWQDPSDACYAPKGPTGLGRREDECEPELRPHSPSPAATSMHSKKPRTTWRCQRAGKSECRPELNLHLPAATSACSEGPWTVQRWQQPSKSECGPHLLPPWSDPRGLGLRIESRLNVSVQCEYFAFIVALFRYLLSLLLFNEGGGGCQVEAWYHVPFCVHLIDVDIESTPALDYAHSSLPTTRSSCQIMKTKLYSCTFVDTYVQYKYQQKMCKLGEGAASKPCD